MSCDYSVYRNSKFNGQNEVTVINVDHSENRTIDNNYSDTYYVL